MTKKIILNILGFIGFILCISCAYSNANYTDLHLEPEWVCANTPIQFHIYNKTDYQNKDEIDRKLCDPINKCDYYKCELEANWRKDVCEPCDNCLYYHPVENAKITIYNGPMDSRPILLNNSLSKKGDFTFTFPSWNEYLIKIETAEDKNGVKIQKYNDYQGKIIVEECKKIEEPKKEYYNQSFNYLNSEVLVNISNTTIKNNSEITVRNDVIIPNSLNNTIKTLAITSKNTEYTKINIKIKYPNNINAETSIYKYDSKTSSWSKITNFKKENEYLVLENGELGIYSIIQEQNEIIENPVIETPISNESINNEDEEVDEVIKETITPNKQETSKIGPIQLGIIILCIILLIIILYGKFGSKTQINYHDKRNEEAKTILTTYEQTYQETSKYVEKYRYSYSKDQLFRALKKSGVPEDIINKVFNEKL